MKIRIFIIIVIVTSPIVFPQAFALCETNRDWEDAPCFDMMPVDKQEFTKLWDAYYDYKGTDFMESKKAELLQVILNGTFHEWDHSHENSNVYHYYLSIGEVPNQYEYFVFEDEKVSDEKLPLHLDQKAHLRLTIFAMVYLGIFLYLYKDDLIMRFRK